MKSIAFAFAGSILCLQAASPPRTLSPRELLEARRQLTAVEIARVFAASREALAGKTVRMQPAGVTPGPELRMRGGGRLARFRTSYSSVNGVVPSSGPATRWTEEVRMIVDYTGRPARACEGSPASAESGASGAAASAAGTGELVIEYTWRRRSNQSAPPAGWGVSARRGGEREAGMPGLVPLFDTLRGITSLDGPDQRQAFGKRSGRGFTAPFVSIHDERPEHPERQLLPSTPRQIGDPEPNVAGVPPPRPEPKKPLQTLWIDTASLLPLRWEVTDQGRRLHLFDFIYEPLDIRIPKQLANGAPPDCIREPSFRP